MRRRKRRGPRPVDRRYLELRCERCGGSLVQDPGSIAGFSGGALCGWCSHMLHKLDKE
jgi:hypothetical protein